MDKFANQSDKERQEILQEAASRRNVNPVIMEKDFWVCWVLRRLTGNAALAPHITFKGGTSLSKAYGLIERFSEDCDLTISRDAPFLSEGKNPMEEKISGKELTRRIDALKQNARRFVEELVLPKLAADIQAALGGTNGWKIISDEQDPDHQTLLFYYPKIFSYGGGFGKGAYGVGAFGEGEIGYIKPHIKLEFGARGEPEPHSARTISPYVAQAFPDLFTVKDFAVSTLAVERSFWEKVTILHALHHGSNMRDRMSRHYYDTYQMAQAGVAKSALAQVGLLEQVVRNKSLMFKDTKASYDTAKIGSLKLVPGTEKIEYLKKDYAAMEEMFIAEYPDFDTVMAGLAELESLINKV